MAAGDAVISLTAGAAGHIYVPAGQTVIVHKVPVRQAIHAKNATAGIPYANLSVTVK